MLYDQYFIDDLKNRADIVRIIQPYAQDLKKKGANWMACCPFHQEKTPSFSVNPSKGFYKCFGCGKGGSVYNFVMEIEGLNFPEAIKRVAEMSGVMLPEPVDDKAYEQRKKKRDEKKQLADQIIELNQIALEFWEKELQGKDKKAKAARKYLDERGISLETQKAFRIGYSPDSWDGLLGVLRDFGADEKVIEQSGLISVNEEKERTFDKFRGRIMFPVLDVNGKPVAFGARSLNPDDQPKYLNSPETAAYTKGQNLYGLFQAKEDIRKKKFAILVEGYLDLIALYQFGVTNVAASLGTAFTPAQSKLLKRFSTKVILNYDGDEAGAKAAKKILNTLVHEEFEVKVLLLPGGMDPDDFLRKNGVEAFTKLRAKAKSVIDFLLDRMPREYNLSNKQQRIAFIDEVIPICAAFGSSKYGRVHQRQLFDELMLAMQVLDLGTQREWWLHVKRQAQVLREKGSTDVVSTGATLSLKTTFAEVRLLKLIARDRQLRNEIIPMLEPTDFMRLATSSIYRAIVAIGDCDDESLFESIREENDDDEALMKIISEVWTSPLSRERDEAIDTVLHDAENCVFSLRNMAITNRIMEISRDATIAEQSNDSTRFNQLTFEQLELEKIRRELQRRISEM